MSKLTQTIELFASEVIPHSNSPRATSQAEGRWRQAAPGR
jgi:hypothetical protein